jgi:hypothetical protein
MCLYGAGARGTSFGTSAKCRKQGNEKSNKSDAGAVTS